MLLTTLLGRFPYLEKLFADSAYQGPIFANAIAKILSRVKIEIVKRSDQAKGFVVLPKRWVVDHRTMLPVWVSNGPYLLTVRAVSDRLLFPEIERRASRFVAGESKSPQVLMRHRRPASGPTADGVAHGPLQGSPSAASARIVRSDKIEPPAPDRRLRSSHADRSARSPAVEPRRCPDFPIEDSESGR